MLAGFRGEGVIEAWGVVIRGCEFRGIWQSRLVPGASLLGLRSRALCRRLKTNPNSAISDRMELTRKGNPSQVCHVCTDLGV